MNTYKGQAVVAILFMGLLAVCTPCVSAEVAGSSGTSVSSQARTVQGSLISVSNAQLQIRRADGNIVSIPVDSSAKVTQNGQTAKLSDLSIGQTIIVEQQAPRNGANTATSIEVVPGDSAQVGAGPASSSSSSVSGSSMDNKATPQSSSSTAKP